MVSILIFPGRGTIFPAYPSTIMEAPVTGRGVLLGVDIRLLGLLLVLRSRLLLDLLLSEGGIVSGNIVLDGVGVIPIDGGSYRRKKYLTSGNALRS